MKVAIISKGDMASTAVEQDLLSYFDKYQFQLDQEDPEIVISIGGDGTLLHAFHQYQDKLDKTAFVGVHTGHLGFYADWRPAEIETLTYALANTPYQVVCYPLLEVIIRFKNGEKELRYLALNESTVRSEAGTLVIDVEIRGQLFETFRGDGLCISTPSGSTGYNKGLGGAIIHPTIEALQIAEMASINNRVFRTVGSPLVLPSAHTCMLRPVSDERFGFTLDHLKFDYNDIKVIQYRIADEKIRFARFRPFPFWNRVRDSFI